MPKNNNLEASGNFNKGVLSPEEEKIIYRVFGKRSGSVSSIDSDKISTFIERNPESFKNMLKEIIKSEGLNSLSNFSHELINDPELSMIALEYFLKNNELTDVGKLAISAERKYPGTAKAVLDKCVENKLFFSVEELLNYLKEFDPEYVKKAFIKFADYGGFCDLVYENEEGTMESYPNDKVVDIATYLIEKDKNFTSEVLKKIIGDIKEKNTCTTLEIQKKIEGLLSSREIKDVYLRKLEQEKNELVKEMEKIDDQIKQYKA